MEPGRWQFWQERCRIGATSRVNVASPSCASAAEGIDSPAAATAVRPTTPTTPTLRAAFIIACLLALLT